MGANEFFAELKRRHVVRVAVVYVVVGFALLQGTDLVFPALNLPQWTFTFLVVLAIFGFPIALVLAWAFDITPEGVKRATTAAAAPVAGLAPAGTGASAAPAAATTPVPAHEDKSIAVLPFINLSDDKDNEYFSDGMTEEILNALVKVKGLHVASRTSSFAFKGKEIDIRDAGHKLSVATVLEGSVRKSGNRIRIAAQLIDVSNGYHLWSETYDR